MQPFLQQPLLPGPSACTLVSSGLVFLLPCTERREARVEESSRSNEPATFVGSVFLPLYTIKSQQCKQDNW